MITYNDYLESIGVISETDFDELMKSFPEIEDVNFEDDDLSAEDIAEAVINKMLFNFNYVYADDIDIENRTFYLNDVDSLEDLEKIKEKFNSCSWEIINYDELETELKESEEEESERKEYQKKMEIINSFIDKISIEQLNKIKEKYND